MNRRFGVLGIFLYATFISSCGDTAPTEPETLPPVVDTMAAKVAWLEENVIAMRSVSPDDEDFSDLQPLKQVIGDSRIVMLGEQSHGDGTTYLAKSRLVKFLHQEMDFDVLAFESNMYLSRRVNTLLEEGQPPFDAMTAGIPWTFSKSEQFQDLVSYIGQEFNSANPLVIAGFDIALRNQSNSWDMTVFLNGITTFLASVGLDSSRYDDWANFREIIEVTMDSGYAYVDPPDSVSQLKLINTIEQIQDDLASITSDPNPRETSFWVQIFENVRVNSERVWNVNYDHYNSTPREILNLRDERMGENLVWLANEYFPNRKILVWAATSHIARNMQAVDVFATPEYEDMVRMGDVVWDSLGSQVYAMGFTAYEGTYGAPLYPNFSTRLLQPPVPHSLEDLVNRAGFENAIVNFRDLPQSGLWLQEDLVCRPFGYTNMMGDWTQLMDGIMYTKTMVPNTPVP